MAKKGELVEPDLEALRFEKDQIDVEIIKLIG